MHKSAPPRISLLDAPFFLLKKAISRAFRDRQFIRAINSKNTIKLISSVKPDSFEGEYLISGEKGVFAIKDKRLLRLFDVRTYGMAIRGQELFTASSNDHYSAILKATLPTEIAPGKTLVFKEIFRIPTNKKGRIHQIAFWGDRLAVTHTFSNAILFLDPESGEVVSECLPFRDHFGQAVRGDHNHINSVSACGDCLLFCAYSAGKRSMLGVIEGTRVKGYAVEHVGAHDVYLTGENLFYSDTFGHLISEGGEECGYLMKNGKAVDPEYFSKPPGWAIRGIAQSGEELVFGHSHKGSRSKRYAGNGGLFRAIDGRVTHALSLPFAQVYDLMRLDGLHFEEPARFTEWESVNAHFERVLGPCIYEQELS